MLQILGTTTENIITSEQTDGAYYQFRSHLPPGEGVPPHVHTAEDELVYVLEGTVNVIFDGKEIVAEAGQGFPFPKGVPHGFFNKIDQPAKLLITVSPGAAFEQFFIELDAMCRTPPVDMSAFFELAGRYGLRFL